MQNRVYELSGPGMDRAVQEGVNAHKDVFFVCDHDSFGRILRVGYALVEGKNRKIKPEEIKWLSPDEYQILPEREKSKDKRAAELRGDYTTPREKDKNERQFLIMPTLGKLKDIRLRYLFRLKNKSVQSFVVQAELRKAAEEGSWVPIVRYDCAHGFIHRDLIRHNGRKTKTRLPAQKLEDAVKLATKEIERNLRLWLIKLGFESRVPETLKNVDVCAELQEARDFLLFLISHPNRITEIRSKFVMIKDKADYTERI